jgi:hypothetical protein
MEKEYKYGKMAPGMKVIGRIIKNKEKENFGMLMEIIMMVIGWMIW